MPTSSGRMLCRTPQQISCGPAVCMRCCSDHVSRASRCMGRPHSVAGPGPRRCCGNAHGTRRKEGSSGVTSPLRPSSLRHAGPRRRACRARQRVMLVVRRHPMSPIAWSFRRERDRARTTLGLAPPSLPFPLPTAASAAYTTAPRSWKAGHRSLVASCCVLAARCWAGESGVRLVEVK